MKPQDEALTPAQQRFFTVVLLLTTLAFSSVFAYAYWKGTQVKMSEPPLVSLQDRNSRLQDLQIRDIKKIAVKVARGTRTQKQRGRFADGGDNAYNWTICKIPEQSGSGPMPCAPVIAYITSPGGWRISVLGVVTVPPDAEPGFYLAHYCARGQGYDYFFEVVSDYKPLALTRAASSATHKLFSSKSKNSREFALKTLKGSPSRPLMANAG